MARYDDLIQNLTGDPAIDLIASDKEISHENFQTVLTKFLSFVSATHTRAPMVLATIAMHEGFSEQIVTAFIGVHCDPSNTDGGDMNITVPHDRAEHFRSLLVALKNDRLIKTELPRSLFLLLISQYDGFVSDLLRCIFTRKSELLNKSDKQMSYSQLKEFDSMSNATKYIIDKEIETVLRDSHADHIKYLERLLSMPLTKDLSVFPEFIEFTQRRNLIAHNDGVVSKQYLEKCKEHNVIFKPKIGDRLTIDQDYISRACFVFSEIAIKLVHTVWRKLFPEEAEAADTSLIMHTFEFLKAKNYDLVIAIGEFAVAMKKHSSDLTRLTMKINLAQAYKWSGEDLKCQRLLSNEDLSCRSPDIQIAVHLLRDEYKEAISIIESKGDSGPFTEKDFREWPLFQRLIKRSDFLESFERIAGKQFLPSTIDPVFAEASWQNGPIRYTVSFSNSTDAI